MKKKSAQEAADIRRCTCVCVCGMRGWIGGGLSLLSREHVTVVCVRLNDIGVSGLAAAPCPVERFEHAGRPGVRARASVRLL